MDDYTSFQIPPIDLILKRLRTELIDYNRKTNSINNEACSWEFSRNVFLMFIQHPDFSSIGIRSK